MSQRRNPQRIHAGQQATYRERLYHTAPILDIVNVLKIMIYTSKSFTQHEDCFISKVAEDIVCKTERRKWVGTIALSGDSVTLLGQHSPKISCLKATRSRPGDAEGVLEMLVQGI